jgi:hypothetical protein
MAAVGLSCKEDTVAPPPQQPPSGYRDLKEKDDVLFNLELAYNERRMDKYDELLDDNFIFYFNDADYNDPHNPTPQQWDRATEVGATTNLLDVNYSGGNRVVSIDLRLGYVADNWTEEPANQVHPGESWYRKTVDYDLRINTAASWELKALDKKAQFTIRWDEDKGKWQMIMWHDLGDDGSLALTTGAAIEETTWGGIKAMYQ